MKTTYFLLAIIFLFILKINYVKAQYTLTDDDVNVSSGIITYCSIDLDIKDIIIPSTLDNQTVIGIQDYVFYANSLTSVDLSSCTSLLSIGEDAFSRNDLSNVLLPASIRSIGEDAFYSNSLNDIDLSNCHDLSYIGQSAFDQNNLTEFTLPEPNNPTFEGWVDHNGNKYEANYVTNNLEASYEAIIYHTLTDNDVVVTNGVIESCSYDFTYKNIIIPTTLDEQEVTGIADGVYEGGIHHGIFREKDIKRIKLPSSITTIGDYAFYKNSIEVLDFSQCSKLYSIGNNAFGTNNIVDIDFSNCTSLNHIGDYSFDSNKLNNLDLNSCLALKTIGNRSFSNNNITNVNYPNTITSIGAATFNGNQVVSVNRNESDGIFYARNNDASIDYSRIVSYGGTSQNITIQSQVLIIGGLAFESTGITSLDLSNCSSLKKIENSAFKSNSISHLDFSNCTSLDTIGDYAFSNNNYLSPTTINLSNCNELIFIGRDAFRENYLTSNLDLSDCVKLKYIGEMAFFGNNLENINLSNCVELECIDDEAFSNNSLNKIDLSPCINLTSIGRYAFNWNNFLQFTLPIPNIEGYTFIHWESTMGTHAGGESVDVSFSYKAILSENTTGNSDIQFYEVNSYPNPIIDFVTIEQPTNDVITSVEFYNLNGQKITTEILETTNSRTIKLYLGKYNSGTYIMKCITRNKNIFSKIVLKK